MPKKRVYVCSGQVLSGCDKVAAVVEVKDKVVWTVIDKTVNFICVDVAWFRLIEEILV